MSNPFERQMREAAINGQASGLSSIPRWAIELDRKLDLVIFLLNAQNKPQEKEDD